MSSRVGNVPIGLGIVGSGAAVVPDRLFLGLTENREASVDCCVIGDIVPASEAAEKYGSNNPCCIRCKLQQACRTLSEHMQGSLEHHSSKLSR